MAKQHHVVPNGDQWGIKPSGGTKSIQNFDTKAEAVARAREISQNQHSELFIHGKDGKIQSRDSHGNDPYPPKG
jgi:hypothetical protein